MVFKHQKFIVNQDARKVFDVNNRELHITGNAYRVLIFLCENKSGTISAISDYLDWAKDYDENHLRQYRYKIETLIGCKVIDYKNGVYSLIGDIEKADNLANNDRNTLLLHSDSVGLDKNNPMNSSVASKLKVFPAFLASVALGCTFLDLPSYAFYVVIKMVVTIVSAYYVHYLYAANLYEKQSFWFWGFIICVILFNPIVPIYLYDKSAWVGIDIIAIIFLTIFVNKFRNKS